MKFVLFLAFAARLVFAAPTTIDAATLLRNGQDAVALNSQWKDLTSTDACQKSEMACIENSIATCANGKWDLSAGQCATGQQCFALPNTRTEGIVRIPGLFTSIQRPEPCFQVCLVHELKERALIDRVYGR